jgi:hypothetical protein
MNANTANWTSKQTYRVSRTRWDVVNHIFLRGQFKSHKYSHSPKLLISFHLAVLPDLTDKRFEKYDHFLKSCKNEQFGSERFIVK